MVAAAFLPQLPFWRSCSKNSGAKRKLVDASASSASAAQSQKLFAIALRGCRRMASIHKMKKDEDDSSSSLSPTTRSDQHHSTTPLRLDLNRWFAQSSHDASTTSPNKMPIRIPAEELVALVLEGSRFWSPVKVQQLNTVLSLLIVYNLAVTYQFFSTPPSQGTSSSPSCPSKRRRLVDSTSSASSSTGQKTRFITKSIQLYHKVIDLLSLLPPRRGDAEIVYVSSCYNIAQCQLRLHRHVQARETMDLLRSFLP